ncbi:MAG TPA: polyphenol oxidase family protein [Solirubrobacteraceae bacterium]|nr:polyphenol oxidase family protein [Solirubrobacteraceae bacterium]
MELPEPFYALGNHFAIDLPGSRVVFSTRRGGHSSGRYESLNLGWLTDDERRAVTRNRETLQSELDAPRLSFVHQIHGSEVRRITAGTAEPPERAGGVRSDGQATDQRDVALCALTADCLPIALAGVGGSRVVAMLHAGWRGLATGMIASGVEAMRELGAVGDLSAAIGPGAGPCCYEVGDEVHEPFAAIPEAHLGRNLDLKAIARHQLRAGGVMQVADIGICTMCSDPGLLFSHRRDRGVTGRQAGVAWLT